MAKLWPGHDSGTHTRTPTHRDKTLYALPLFYGGKKLAGVGMFGDRGDGGQQQKAVRPKIKVSRHFLYIIIHKNFKFLALVCTSFKTNKKG